MTTESFTTIREICEVPNGLRIEHHDGSTSFLGRDNLRFAKIVTVFENSMGRNLPWPVYITRREDGVLVNAWYASGGRVYAVDEEANGDCTAYILLLNSPVILKRNHPEFDRLFETLMLSAGEKRDVFYCEVPGQENILADVCFAS